MLPANIFSDMLYLLLIMVLCLPQTLSSRLGRSSHVSRIFLRQRFYDMAKRTQSRQNIPKDVKQAPLDTSVFQPWSCGCNYFWRDLGDGYSPRFIQDGRCKTKTCYYGHYSCVPYVYQVQVLKRVDPLNKEPENRYRHSLGDNFTFVKVNVTVNCECRHDVVGHGISHKAIEKMKKVHV